MGTCHSPKFGASRPWSSILVPVFVCISVLHFIFPILSHCVLRYFPHINKALYVSVVRPKTARVSELAPTTIQDGGFGRRVPGVKKGKGACWFCGSWPHFVHAPIWSRVSFSFVLVEKRGPFEVLCWLILYIHFCTHPKDTWRGVTKIHVSMDPGVFSPELCASQLVKWV